MEHEKNTHWWLVEDGNGQVGKQHNQERGTRKDGMKIGREKGQGGVRRKSYSAAVIDGIKRNSTICVGDSIVRKTDSTLNKDEDIVVGLPGARIEHVTVRVQRIMGCGNGGTLLVHIGTNNTDKEGTTAIVKKYRNLLKKTKEARLDRLSYQGFYQCLEPGAKVTEIRGGWPSTGL